MPYVMAENLSDSVKSQEEDSIKLFQWLSNYQMKANHNKNFENINVNEFEIGNTE